MTEIGSDLQLYFQVGERHAYLDLDLVARLIEKVYFKPIIGLNPLIRGLTKYQGRAIPVVDIAELLDIKKLLNYRPFYFVIQSAQDRLALDVNHIESYGVVNAKGLSLLSEGRDVPVDLLGVLVQHKLLNGEQERVLGSRRYED